jgi:hypothetical protein
MIQWRDDKPAEYPEPKRGRQWLLLAAWIALAIACLVALGAL